MKNQKGKIYLLHFDKPLPTSSRGIQHYLGFAENLDRRINEHRNGIQNHNALPMAFYSHGIGFVVAVTWTGTRTDERTIKKRKKASSLWCPECQKQRLTGQVVQSKTENKQNEY